VVIPKLPDPTNFVLRPRSFDFTLYSPDDSDSAVERLVATSDSCSVYSDDDSEDDVGFPFLDVISDKATTALALRSNPSSLPTALLPRKSPSPPLSTDNAASPPHFIHAGWDNNGNYTCPS
jgi:hypothetical protein